MVSQLLDYIFSTGEACWPRQSYSYVARGVAANIATKTFAPITSFGTMVGKESRKAYYKATNSEVVINIKKKATYTFDSIFH